MSPCHAFRFLVAVAISLVLCHLPDAAAMPTQHNLPQQRNRFALTSTAIRCRQVPSPAWARCASGMKIL